MIEYNKDIYLRKGEIYGMNKRIKSIAGVVFSLVIIIGFFIIHNIVYSSDEIMYFSIEPLIYKNEPAMGYAIGNPNTAGNNAAKIWNIVKRSGPNTDDIMQGDFYCLKASVGFEDINANVTYDVFYDLKKEKSSLIAQNDLIKGFLTGTISENGESYGRYEALLALLDMLYLPNTSEESYKEELLDNVMQYAINDMDKYGSYIEVMMLYPPTDNDIVAIQQAAIWYFTNYGEDNGKFDKTNSSSWINYTDDGNSYSTLSDYNYGTGEGEGRSAYGEALYNYLIDKAKEGSKNYTGVDLNSSSPITLKTSILSYEELSENYILGPIHLDEKENNNLIYTLQMSVSNEEGNITNYKLLNSNKEDVTSTKTIQDLIGQDFYISINKSEISALKSDIKVDFDISYELTSTVVAAVNNDDNQQPVAISEKQKINSQESLTVTIDKRTFDLALRKYITKVGSTELTGENLRVPNVDESTLKEGTTATYKHKKDPVLVNTGDIVTYKITIYNEGEKAGRATEVIDQLPTGLEFVRVVSGNFEEGSYEENINKLTLVRVSGNNNNLPAYTGEGDPSSESIEIECRVVEEAGERDKVLTNIAWISKEVDGESNTEIINQEGLDRDSEPGRKPTCDKDSMEDYNGNENKEDLSDSNNYYKGEQDDDDFEKLILKKAEGNYKIQIVKVDKENKESRLSGAEFKITLADGSTVEETTGTDGTIETKDIDITSSGVDTIKVEEITAPEGYNKLFNSFELDVTKGLVDGTYVVTDINLKNGEGSGLGTGTVNVDYLNNLVTITVPNEKIKGNYNIQLEKVDSEDNTIKLSGAVFDVTLPGINESEQKTTNENGIIDLGTVEIADIGAKDTIIIREITAPEGYNLIQEELRIEIEKQEVEGKYYIENVSIISGNENADITFDGSNIKITVKNEKIKEFDLALRKFIIAVSDDENIENGEFLRNEDGSYIREPVVDTSLLNTIDEDGTKITTAIYNHTKEPVTVRRNDYVVYMLRVYNEGDLDGYAAEIKDHLPSYLEFVDNNFNKQYGWEISEDGRTVTTRYLENSLINAAEEGENGYTLSYVEVPIMCKVTAGAMAGENITNIADITEYQNEEKEPAEDRDSEEDNVELPEDEELPGYKDEQEGDYIPGQEDDDDFEKVVVEDDKFFDLALRKFIIAVSDDENIENGEFLRNEDGSYIREPVVDTSLLNTIEEDGNKITTAIYKHTKEPVVVKRNSYVIYMLRVYNEGDLDGYASEIKDHLPPYLEFVDNEFNEQYGWEVLEDGRTVTTRYLENSLINAAEEGENGYTLSYVEVPIMCKVTDGAIAGENITNIADITEYQNEEKEPVEDRDSEEDNVDLPTDEELPEYKDEQEGDYIPGQEDDDDFEKVVLKEFDLALRKFITKVDDKNVTNRIPEVSYDQATGEITYNHTKDPVQVTTDNIVTYTIRVYNEGAINGYASEITDDIPEGLEFLPDNETNINYRWVMYDAEGNVTENVEEAISIKTDYLSKEQEESPGDNLLLAFNPDEPISETNPSYKDVQVVFRVIEPNESDRVLVNSAQISDDSDEDGNPVDDKDSIPDEWNDGEDDQDREYVELVYFDLSLRKWVTQAIVIDKDGNQAVTETGHKPYDEPEQIVKVDIYRKSIYDVTVKFRYKIRVTNEGEIAGYATEITDYVPEGLRFLPEDNPGWTDEGNNVISTRLLENTLLQPGEYAEVEVVLTWINGEDNMGEKVNIAEISEDYNDYGAPDKDSTPDNQVDGEDDQDDAPVLLSVSTGQVRIYFTLGFVILITIAGGVLLIKKFVL